MKRKYLRSIVKWRRYYCGDANDASWRFLASKGHVTKYASYWDMIQFCKIEGKENNAITYVSQSSYEIGSWEFPFKISIIRILYCLKSRELLLEIESFSLIFEVLKKNFQILCFRLIIQIKVVKSQRVFSWELNLWEESPNLAFCFGIFTFISNNPGK